MSLLDKYTKKYGNVSRVNSLRKQEDWMPKTPMSDEKASNIRAAHQYMDSLTDDDKKRIMDESPLGKSAGYQGSQNGLFGIGKKQNAKEWETYTAAEDIINAEKYEKKRESVVRGYGKQAYDAMNSYLENKSWADEYGHLTKEGKDYLAQAEKNLSTLKALGIKGEDLKKYQQYISEYRDIKATEQREKEIRRNVQGSPVGMGTLLTAADVATSPVSGFLAAAEALKRPFYADREAPVNTYGNLYALSNTERATEQAVSDQINSNFGKFLYGTGVSTLKSAEAMAIAKGLGNVVGIDAASKLGQVATLPIFGTSAFASTVKEAQDKGFSADKAVMKGLASGMAEMIFEELSLDKAWGTLQNAKLGKGGFKKRLLDIFMGAGIEGSEEIFTSLANHITDQAINGDFSDYQTEVRMNVENGMSLDEATRTAKMDFLTQLVEDGLAGALSGGFMNVGAATVGSINYHNTAKNVNNNAELKKEVYESAKGLDGTTAAEIANSKPVEQITENDMVEIIHSMEEATQRNAHNIAKETLVKMGESEESAEEKANAIVEMSTQENPTEEQEAKNIELVSDEKNAEAYTNVLKSRVAQNTVNDIYENNQVVGKKRKGGVNAYVGDKQIKVYDFADVAKGRVNTSVGVMSLSDAKMDENTGRLFRTAYVFEDTPTSNAYIENYKGQNLSDYSTAAMRAFVVGASGAKFETFLNDASNAYAIEAVNDNAFLQEMYFHGQNTAKKEDVATVDKTQAETKKVSGENALNPVFNEVAKAFNLNIETSGETSQSSGSFVPSLLKINLNEKESKNMYQTLHHELMEYSKAYAPEAYERLKGAVMDFATSKLGSPKVKMHLEAYRDTYRGFGRKVGDQAEASKNIADATDEYVNDFVAQVMTTEEGINQFAEYLSEKNMSESEKTSIIQSIKDFIQKIIDTIKSYLTGKNGMNIGSKDAKMLEQYTEDLANIRDYIEQAWDEAREEVIVQLTSKTKDDVTDENLKYSIRTEAAPQKTLKGYKVFVAFKNKPGELYPPMVASPEGLPTPVGLWLNADTGELARDKEGNIITTKGGQGYGKRVQVKQGGKGTKGGSGTLAWRPGWHLGEYPDAKQFAVKDPITGELKALFPENFIFAECEIAADEDYQLEAMEYGISKTGKFNRTYAGLPYIPQNGYYKYRTNPDPQTSPWYITGAMKVTKILDDEDIRKICKKYGVTPLARRGGDINLEEFGFKKGNVTPTKDTSKYVKPVDYSDEIKQLEGYQINGRLDFNDKNVINEFKINNLDASEYEKQYNKKTHSLNVDSDGNALTDAQIKYFADSKVRDAEGRLLKVMHGTEADFTVFNPKESGGKNGTAEGYGIYFSDDAEITLRYGGRQLEGYLNITKPAYDNKKTITMPGFIKLLKATTEYEAKKWDMDIKDTWISNYEDTYSNSLDAAYRSVAKQILEGNDNDKDIIQEVMVGMGIRNYNQAYEFYDILKNTLGFDGFEVKWTHADGTSNVYVALDSNQFKLIENVEPTDNEDIRYSINVDSEGKELTEKQKEFFANSKLRDKDGKLIVMYHGTFNDFTVFDIEKANEDSYRGQGFYFTNSENEAKRTYASLEGGDSQDKLDIRASQILEEWGYTWEGDIEYPTKYDTHKLYGPDSWTRVPADKGKKLYDKAIAKAKKEFKNGKVMKVYLNIENPYIIPKNNTKNTWAITEEIYKGNYDGIIDYSVSKEFNLNKNVFHVTVFKANQIKSVDNENPTENEDIRHSLDVEDWEADFFAEMTSEQKEVSKILTEGLKSLDNIEVNKKITDKIAREIKAEYKSRINTKTLSDSLQKIFAYMLDSGSPGYADIVEIMKEVGRPVIEQATEVNQAEKQMYDHLMETLKTYKIRLNDSQKAEVANTFGTYYGYKNALFGKAVFSESGSDLDGLWTEIVDASSGLLDYGTNPADQPMALYEIIEALKPSQTNLYGADQEEAAYDVALSIFRKFLVEQEYENNPKLRAEALKLTEAQQNFKKKLKENYEKRYKEETESLRREREMNMKRLAAEIKSLSEQEADALKGSIEQAFLIRQRNQYEYRLKKLRESKNEETDRKLAELRAKQRNSQTKRIEGRMITQAKARIRKNVETLNSMLAHGTENRHVPINMVRSTIEMLEAIDINTGNSKSLAKYLEKMENIYTGLKDAEAYAFDYDERTRQNIDNLKKLFADRNYTQLSLDELNQVVDITKALIQQIQNANKLMLKKKKADAVEFSREAIREVREAKHIDNAFMNGLDHYLTPHLNAFREFRKLSGYKDGRLMELYRDLDEGQLKQISVMRDINELFDDVLKNTKEVKNFTSTDEKDLVDSGLKDEKGNPVMITKAQRMSIIMHSYNDRNMEHIIYGGIRVPDLTKKDRKEALARAKIYFYVPPTDIRAAILGDDVERLDLITERATMKVKELEKQLSPWEKEFLTKVKEMFWHKTGGYINETSLKLKGYALARVGKYFPIPTDQNFIKKDIGNLVQDGTLEGKGFLKERKFGRNAIILEDITDTILRQTNDVAKYTGLAIPLRNLNMAWNTTVFTNAVADTLSNAVSNAWGKNNVDYISNLVVDLTSRRDGGDATFLDAMRGRFAGAVLTLNPSVSIKQAASYFTAGAIVGNRVLAKTAKDIGKGFFKKQGIAELEKNNPLLWYRNQGNATQELADMKRTGFGKNLPIKVQKALNWVEFMDTGTVRTLEYAAKNYVDANFNLSGAEYWNKVSEVFTQIVEQTQPNYTPLQQADIIRNPNKALKLLVMFKTQPLQNMGVIYDAIGELKTRVKEGADTKEAKQKLIRAITSQVQSAMTFSMMTILANLLLHKFYKYKDDDDKFSWEKVLEEFGAGITKSFWGMLLFGQEVVDALQSLLNGEKMNGLNVSFLDNIANLGNACMNLQKQTQKRLDAKTEADRQKYNNGILIYGGKVADYIGQIGGVPVGNLKNMIESLILYGLDVSEGEIGVSEISTKVDSQYDRMYEALVANDRERYMKLFNEMVEVKTSDGKTQAEAEKSVNDSVKSYIKEGYAAGELTYEQAYTILTKDIGMSETDAYYKLDEWLYKSEGNDSYTKYSRMKDAIDEVIGGKVDRTDIKTTISDLMKNGVSAETVRGQITKTYRQQYLELKSKNQASTLKSILLTAYMATGMTEDEANKKIDAWK